MAELRAKHAFGTLERIDTALSAGTIDAYDILFVKDENGKPYVGWIDKDGKKVIVQEDEKIVNVEGESLPESGEEGKVYIFDDQGYFWNGTEFKNFCKPTDLTKLEEELATKVSSEEVDAKIDEKIDSIELTYEEVKYLVSHKPNGTIVDYRDKEVRIMCPSDTQWVLQQSGEGSEANVYYIGFKAYAPSDDVVSFKEDLAKVIADETMYYFVDNEFAGVEKDGRKYSIVWLPAAKYDAETSTWTYYGASSTVEKYIGWYYSVEWYNANGVVVASDCIRINLSNEECHSSIEPYYVSDMVKQIQEVVSGFEVVEF